MSVLSSTATVVAVSLDNNAGGASAADLGLAGGVGGFALIFMLMGGLGHRGGLIPTLGWFERFSEKVSGQPAWASLPCGLAIISLITSLFGLYWDVSLHIDRGRDPGVFSNPSHWFILGGLYGIFAAGFFAICLGREERADRPGPTAIRITRDWYAPLGGVLMMTTGLFSLIAFPLDDFWHRLFGQDVTLWGPTHLMLIGGAVMTLLAIAVIQAEVVRAMKVAGVMHKELAWVRHLRVVWLPGGLLIGMSTFQGEFDFGVPQFQMIFHPLLIMLAAGLTLVMTRIWLGRGALFGAIGFFIVMRLLLNLIVHDSLGESLTHFPLYIAEALCVEAAALLVSTRRPLAFGATAGALVGTVGLAAEWGWSHVWMPLPWSGEILLETIALGLAMAVSASLLGAWIGARLSADDLPYSETSHLRPFAVVAALAVFAMLAFPLFTKTESDVSAKVALTDVQSAPKRTVNATVTLNPRTAADHANWLTVTSWQGGGQLIADRLERVSEGVYRTTQPVPVYGEWKTMVRLAEGRSIAGLPIYAPEDRAIPVAGVAAPARFERDFLSDHELLQREAKTQNQSITYGAYGAVLFFALALLAMLAWGLHRVGTTAGRKRDTPTAQWGHDETPDAAPRHEELAYASNGHEELPDWARPQPTGRETAGSRAGR
ncbi:MAG: hypothetical protein QOG42_341 [Solirubrobacteraceae bacterium]|nr:hypothetical protein [Solirubrobacteraceae bacterium]